MAWKFWLVIGFQVFNWGLEARKWQLLMRPLATMSFFTAYKSVLCGVTFSLNTPNQGNMADGSFRLGGHRIVPSLFHSG